MDTCDPVRGDSVQAAQAFFLWTENERLRAELADANSKSDASPTVGVGDD